MYELGYKLHIIIALTVTLQIKEVYVVRHVWDTEITLIQMFMFSFVSMFMPHILLH